MACYVGVAALTMVRCSAGGDRRTLESVFPGQLVPSTADPDELTRLLAGGFIEELEELAPLGGDAA
jgi:hypothetical protein